MGHWAGGVGAGEGIHVFGITLVMSGLNLSDQFIMDDHGVNVVLGDANFIMDFSKQFSKVNCVFSCLRTGEAVFLVGYRGKRIEFANKVCGVLLIGSAGRWGVDERVRLEFGEVFHHEPGRGIRGKFAVMVSGGRRVASGAVLVVR